MPERKHRVSPVAGNFNIADIGTKRLPKHRLEQLMAFCNIGSINGDSFLSLRQDQILNQNQLRQTVGALPAWQLRLMVLGALVQPAQSFSTEMHDKMNEPNTVWLVVATVMVCIFSLLCRYGIVCQFYERFRGMLAFWLGSNDVDSNLDAATKRPYLTSPLSEVSDPHLWMRLNHHDDFPDGENSPQRGSPVASGSSVLDLELRILILLDWFVDCAMTALQQKIEPGLAIGEAMYVLRVAYRHLLESHTHKDDVEDIIEIHECKETDNYFTRRNYALQWVVAANGHYGLQRGSNMAEELKFVMDCLIHRLNHDNEAPKAIYKSLKSTMDSLWNQFCADISTRDVEVKESHTESDSNMDVDTAVDEPPLAIPNLDDQLEELRIARERAVRTLTERHQDALDRGDMEAADFYDDQINLVTHF